MLPHNPTAFNKANAMFSNGMNLLKPDHVFHLGDTYYYGESSEFTNALYNPVKANLPKGTSFWNIPGNHDVS